MSTRAATSIAAVVTFGTHVAFQAAWAVGVFWLFREYEPASIPVIWLVATILLLLVVRKDDRIATEGVAIGSFLSFMFFVTCSACAVLPRIMR